MKKAFYVIVGIMILGLFGCGQQKYKLNLDGYGLESKKSEYPAGATVKVTYDLIATDTDYEFELDCDDTELNLDYVNDMYVMTFKMPAHDVTLSKSQRNSMVYMPEVQITLENQIKTGDLWIMEDTPEKRKQSLWGDTKIKACPVNERMDIMLDVVSFDSKYIVRMIDEDGLFYEAAEVEITNGQYVVITSKGRDFEAYVCVFDRNEDLVNEYEMFVAAL